jgi:hypothetical protein
MLSLVIFHLLVVVHDPVGLHVVDMGPFPSRAFCEADRTEILGKLRLQGGIVGPGARVVATGCVSPGARVA